jgi:TRAP-type C4-dicarboxylate transport system permease small subunit
VRIFINWLARLLDASIGFALMLMLGVILLQVVLRYGFSDGLIWGEEFARIMMIAAALIGAAVAHHEAKHIRFDLLEQILPIRFKRVLALLSEMVVFATAAVLTWYGWELTVENEFQESLTLGISMAYIYVLVPLGMGLLALASLQRLIKLVRGGDTAAHQPGEIQ